MNQLDDLKRYLELSEYVEFTDSKGRLLHSIKSEKLLLPFLAHEQLQKRFEEAVEALKKVKHNGCCMVCSSDCPACNAHQFLSSLDKGE